MALNKKQQIAVNSDEPNVLIIAPAGSGKTTTLVAAIKRFKDQKPNAEVVAITFTKKSAEDLRTKLSGYRGIAVSTIHSWAYAELEILSEELQKEDFNNTFKIKLLQDERIKEILKELCDKRKYYYIKVDILYHYIMGNYNMDISDRLKSMFKAIEMDYIRYKDRHGLYDFTDLPNYLLDKLNDYDRNITHIDGFFVDEFQDVDDVQLEVFDRVIADKKFYIGDPQQAIYIFRGATEDVINQVQDFKLYELDVNYRSNQEIIDFATTYQNRAKFESVLFSSQLESFSSKIKTIKGKGGRVYILNRKGHAYKVNEFIKENGEKLIENILKDQPMILCRKNKEVRKIKEIGYDNVSTIHQAKGLEYEKVIVTDFEIRDTEDVNIAYVAMTRAETDLIAANYEAFIQILERLKAKGKIIDNNSLF